MNSKIKKILSASFIFIVITSNLIINSTQITYADDATWDTSTDTWTHQTMDQNNILSWEETSSTDNNNTSSWGEIALYTWIATETDTEVPSRNTAWANLAQVNLWTTDSWDYNSGVLNIRTTNTYTQNHQTPEDLSGENSEPEAIKITNSDKKPIFNHSWLIILDSINSADVKWWSSTYCSLIAKLNLENIFPNLEEENWLADWQKISIWNAIDIINAWKDTKKLTQVENNINTISDYFWSGYESSWNSIQDIYIYDPNGSWEFQWHRIVWFIAENQKIYILDPIKWWTTSPILLSDYISNIKTRMSVYFYYYGFGDQKYILTMESQQKQIPKEHYPNKINILELIFEGKITPIFSETTIGIWSLKVNENIILEDSQENFVIISNWTKLQEASWKNINLTEIWFTEASWGNLLSFEASWQKISFDKPVYIISKTNTNSWSVWGVLIKQCWSGDLATWWIINSTNISCESRSSSDKNNNIYIYDGYINFFSCNTWEAVLSWWSTDLTQTNSNQSCKVDNIFTSFLQNDFSFWDTGILAKSLDY